MTTHCKWCRQEIQLSDGVWRHAHSRVVSCNPHAAEPDEEKDDGEIGRMRADDRAVIYGVDPKETVRQGLIKVRDEELDSDSPRWDHVTLLSHAIWWLAE